MNGKDACSVSKGLDPLALHRRLRRADAVGQPRLHDMSSAAGCGIVSMEANVTFTNDPFVTWEREK